MDILNIIKVGEVCNTYPEECSVRVGIGENEDGEFRYISGKLLVLQQKTMNDKYYYMPDLGESVVCLLLGNSGFAGFVLGSVYSAVDVPFLVGQRMSGVQYKDGAIFSYDSENSKGRAVTGGDFEVVADRGVSVSTKNNVVIEGGNIDVNCDTVNLGKSASMEVVHKGSLCPMWGVCHNLPPFAVTKTALASG